MSLDGETEGAYSVKERNFSVDRVCVLWRKLGSRQLPFGIKAAPAV